MRWSDIITLLCPKGNDKKCRGCRGKQRENPGGSSSVSQRRGPKNRKDAPSSEVLSGNLVSRYIYVFLGYLQLLIVVAFSEKLLYLRRKTALQSNNSVRSPPGETGSR